MIYKRPTTLSPAGARFIARFEGLVLHPYNDPKGYATIGIGHLLHQSPVTDNDRATWVRFDEHQALALLQHDAAAASRAVHDHVTARINQAQHDALASFAFNVGVGAFLSSTLLKRLNTHPGTIRGVVGATAKREVREQLLRWVDRGTREEHGLTLRRIAEGHLFTTGRYD